MSAELAIAKQIKSYGMRLIEDTKFDAENMIDASDDVINSGIVLPTGSIISIPYYNKENAVLKVDVSSETFIFPDDFSTTGSDQSFGNDVAISDNYYVVGAYEENSVSGSAGGAYVYNIEAGTHIKLLGSNIHNGSSFGRSVACTDTKVLVGANSQDVPISNGGSAYLYNIDGSNEQIITPSDITNFHQFGISCSMSENKMVIGADRSDTNLGSAYIYNIDGTNEIKLLGEGGNFGYSVANTDTKVIVGAPTAAGPLGVEGGVCYIYDIDGTNKITLNVPPGTYTNLDEIGKSVAINDEFAFIGNPGRNEVYIYTLQGIFINTITPSDMQNASRFGYEISVSDNNIIVGDFAQNIIGGQDGAVYLYNIDGTNEQKIIPTINVTSGAQFGASVAANSNTLIIGANRNNTHNDGDGAAYKYDLKYTF